MPGFAGRDGCRGGLAAGGGTATGRCATGAGKGVGAVTAVVLLTAGATGGTGEGLAAAARALSCCCFSSCCCRIFIRVSSFSMSFTKSFTSPDLPEE